MLATNDKLEVLKLCNNPLGSEGVTWIAKALISNKGVKRLDLRNTKCDDKGAEALANMLAVSKTLKCLFLCLKLNFGSICQNIIGDV